MSDKLASILSGLDGSVPKLNPFLYIVDSYKVSHKRFETEGVTEICSNFTARFDKYMQELLGPYYSRDFVVFGVQYAILRLAYMANEGFFLRNKSEVLEEMRSVHGPYIQNEDFEHFGKLHDLGYLPIEIKALPEGTIAPIATPFLVIRNTHPEFEWLPNFLEPLLSVDIWKPLTVATVGYTIRKITNEFALKTTGSLAGTEFQLHDFHVRGASGFESAAIDGAAFLLSSCGTDNIPALWAANKFYGTKVTDGFLAASVPAGEHSVTTSGILAEVARAKAKGEKISLVEGERRYALSVLKDKFPSGIVSYVADSFDYWNFVEKVLPSLKDEIMSRDGKFVVRGDSGDPVAVIAGFDESGVLDLDRVQEEELAEVLFDEARDRLADETPHGEHGDDECTIEFWHHGVLKSAEISGFQWNRHDKQYYYLDTFFSDVTVKISEVERTAVRKGTIETLWEIFGGTVNEQGYKVLDSHIGMIYGDGITPQRQFEILKRLEAKGFASLNVVFGVGSYTLNYLSRDHLGMAIKATNQLIEIDGVVVDQPIYKEPKTDASKKSLRGLIRVDRDADGRIVTKDKQSREQFEGGLLEVVYSNGVMLKADDIFTIRDRIWK